MSPSILRRRLVLYWLVLTRDPVALTELLSGLFLVGLRGLLLVWSSRLLVIGSDVAALLRTVGVTEQRWGTYLMVLGVLQIAVVGTRHCIYRFYVTLGILAGFVVLAAGYQQTEGWASVPASLVCMSGFYSFLLARVMADWRVSRSGAQPRRLRRLR